MNNIQNKKTCPSCKINKNTSEYSKNKSRIDGLGRICKACKAIEAHKYYLKNKHKIKEYLYQWRSKNPEKNRAINTRWDHKNKEKKKIWWQLNRDKQKEYNAKHLATPHGKVNQAIRTGIWRTIKASKNGQHWESLVGYSIKQLKKHLEKKFTLEMNWDNYGSYWEIDHKIPIAAFNFKTPDDIDFKRCWSLVNLQPLHKVKNRSKGAQLSKPFQPSLLMQVMVF